MFLLVISCSDAGNWLFRGRRWIDPADPDGRTMLELHHHNLSILFPSFTAACSLDRFIDVVAAVVDSWSRQADIAAEGRRCWPVVDVASSRTAIDSDSASPSEVFATVRHGGCLLLTVGPDRDAEEDDGGWPDTWMGVLGVGAHAGDDVLRPLASRT